MGCNDFIGEQISHYLCTRWNIIQNSAGEIPGATILKVQAEADALYVRIQGQEDLSMILMMSLTWSLYVMIWVSNSGTMYNIGSYNKGNVVALGQGVSYIPTDA